MMIGNKGVTMLDINYRRNTGNPPDRSNALYGSEMPMASEHTVIGVR